MDALIARIQVILSPAQSWSAARCARWTRVWQWRRKKLGLDITPGQARIRVVNSNRGNNVADSESTTFTQVVEREAGVAYKTAQRWVRWGALGRHTLRAIEGTAQDDLRHLDALWSAQRAAAQHQTAPSAPAVVGKWGKVEDRFHLPEHGIELRLGDSEQMLATLDAESFDAIISDQPYGVAYRDSAGVGIAGDEDPEPIASWSCPAMARVLKPNAFAILHGTSLKRLPDGRYVQEVWQRHLASAGTPMVDDAVWDKETPGLGSPLMHQNERIWICAKGQPLTWHRGQSDIWRFPRPADTDHPMPKPVELHEREMLIFSAPRSIILDPFCGTGPTAVAALRTGRRYLGIELDERWYQAALERVQEALDRAERLAA